MLALLWLAAILLGWIFGAVGWCLFLATLCWLGLQFEQFRRVARWSNRPWSRPENGSEAWFNLAYPPYRTLLRERRRNASATQRLRQILNLVELIPDALLVLGANGELQGMNNAATKLLRIGKADLGIGLSTILRDPAFVGFLRPGESDDDLGILEFNSPINPDHNLEARLFQIDDGGQILLIRDITTLNRLLTVRQNFVANVSHELRTPLAVVQGYMETITDPQEDESTRLSLTSRLVSPLTRMQALVDDLMLLTRLESTEPEDEKVRVELTSTIRGVVKDLGDLLDASNRVNVTAPESAYVLGNATEIHSLCINLISNALRYSAEDKPVDVTCEIVDGNVYLEVKDYGVGIAPEHLERLTERFYRVDMADSRSRGGTGLGLAIVKHVLRRLNSKLAITSELGRGSSFACNLAQHHVQEQK